MSRPAYFTAGSCERAVLDRGNELVIAGQALLRFPSVLARTEPWTVVDQLKRALAVAASASRVA